MHAGTAEEPGEIGAKQRRATRLWIPLGAALFCVALAISALVVPQQRLLHVLQSFIYVAVVILGARNNVFGLGAGVTIAAAWNALNLFVTHLMQAGAVAFWAFLHTGQARRLDTMMVTVGGIGHFILIFGCLADLHHRSMNKKRWWEFVIGGIASLAYFALIIVIAAPR